MDNVRDEFKQRTAKLKNHLLSSPMTRDQAIERLAGFLATAEMMMARNHGIAEHKELLMYGIQNHPDETMAALDRSNQTLNVSETSTDPFNLALQGYKVQKKKASTRARNAANALHDKPGGNRSKQDQIRNIWASGKYDSRDICAEEECASLNMSFSAARKALRNTPTPS
jgi:hypothetical protein